MAYTKIDHIRINQFKVAMHQYLSPNFFLQNCFVVVVDEDITFSLHGGEIWKRLLQRELIRHLCEHDNDILFTSAFIQNGRILQIYTDLSSWD